jgi:hypothetical protein
MKQSKLVVLAALLAVGFGGVAMARTPAGLARQLARAKAAAKAARVAARAQAAAALTSKAPVVAAVQSPAPVALKTAVAAPAAPLATLLAVPTVVSPVRSAMGPLPTATNGGATPPIGSSLPTPPVHTKPAH